MRVIDSLQDLQGLVGQEIGVSDWMCIDQARINRFADATDDHQWIHVDVERAQRESPLGGPVAHGFLTLSLLPAMMQSIFTVEGVTTRINYGLNTVRFIAPVAAGAHVRARVTLESVEPRGAHRYLVRNGVTIELQASDKPACVAQALTLYIQ